MADFNISKDFTVDDIHKIRERNYERTKNMTVAEKLEYYNTPRTSAEMEIAKRREMKKKSIASA